MELTDNMRLAMHRQPERRHPAGCPCAVCKRPVSAPIQPTLPAIVATSQRLDFFLEFEPPTVTAQHKGAQIIIPKTWPQQPHPKPFIHWYTKKEIEEAEKTLATHLAPFRPATPFQGPLRLVAEWTFPWRTSEPKKNRGAGSRWKDTAPDVDNSQKALSDVMQRLGFYADDSQIADLRITKSWGDRPGIKITLEQLQQP